MSHKKWWMPTWCNDKALKKERQEFLDSWRPRVGPDFSMFEKELDKLLEMCAFNANGKAEFALGDLQRQGQRHDPTRPTALTQRTS